MTKRTAILLQNIKQRTNRHFQMNLCIVNFIKKKCVFFIKVFERQTMILRAFYIFY